MSADAIRSPVISKIREEVPEFEDTFQATLLEEEGELGSFEAMSTFAAWVLDTLRTNRHAPAIERSFSIIEHVAGAGTYPMGQALVTEFVEAIGVQPDAISLLGPSSRAYLGSR